jgi:hypothetical protein
MQRQHIHKPFTSSALNRQDCRQEFERSNPVKYRIIIGALFIAFTYPAFADFVTVSRAYELNPDLVSVPPTPSSRMRFRDCSGCDATSAQLTEETRFSVDGKAVHFKEFCDAVRLAQQSEHSAIILLHHLESDAVVSVSVLL